MLFVTSTFFRFLSLSSGSRPVRLPPKINFAIMLVGEIYAFKTSEGQQEDLGADDDHLRRLPFPLLGLQILIQEWGTNLIREQVYNTAYSNVNYLSSHFCDNIETLHTTAEYLTNVDIVREFFVFHDNYSTAEYYEKIDNIQDFLYRMNQSNPFIGETRLYFPAAG